MHPKNFSSSFTQTTIYHYHKHDFYLFNLNSPPDTITVPTELIGPNPSPNPNSNPPLNNNNQQPNNNPSTSQFFTINSSLNPSTSQYIPYTTNSPFITLTSSPTTFAHNTHNPTFTTTNTVFRNPLTFQQQTQ